MKLYRLSSSAILFLAVGMALLFFLLFSPEALQQESEALPQRAPQQTWSFTGNVYAGTPPNSGSPILGAQVALYGSNNAAVWGSLLDSDTTSLSGHYQLNVANADYTYFHIIETDKPGYVSTGAQAGTGGVVVNDNWIRYEGPEPGSHGNNNFWDRRLATNTPTPGAPTATPTHQPTYTPTSVSTGTPTATPTQAPAGEADLRLTKVRGEPATEPVPPGSQIRYDLTVSNRGPGAALGVTITDTLPEGLTFDSASPGCGLVQQGPPHDVVRCVLGALPSFPPDLSLWVRANVTEQACGWIENQSQVTSDTPDPLLWNNTGYQRTLIAPCNRPGVLIRKYQLAPPYGEAQPGDIVTYAVEIENIGNEPLQSVRLDDLFPSQFFAFVDASFTPSQFLSGIPDATITWFDLTQPSPHGFGQPLAPGERFTVQVRLQVQTAGSGTNCAEVQAHAGDAEVSDEACTYLRVDDPAQALRLTKSIQQPASGPAVVGQSIAFMIEFQNSGDTPIVGIRLRDEYDNDLLDYSHAAYTPDSPMDDGVLDWADLTRGSPLGWGAALAPSSGRGFSINFKARAATPVDQPTSNCVQAWYWHADEQEHETPLVCIPLEIRSSAAPGLAISKTLVELPDGVAQPGNIVSFQYRITNNGTIPFTDISVQDEYDLDCLRFVPSGIPALDPDDPNDDGDLEWAHWLGSSSLAPGASIEVISGLVFQARAGFECDPTVNHIVAMAATDLGQQVTASAEALVSIRILTSTATPTPTVSPTATPTPTVTATSTVSDQPLYLPLIRQTHD